MAVVLISATRSTKARFGIDTPLGRSLEQLKFDTRIRAVIAFENRFGLPMVYNAGLSQCEPGDIAVFVHDDVSLDDYYLADRLAEATQQFDVVGCVGNRRRQPMQPGWGFLNEQGLWDDQSWLSGTVAHGSNRKVTRYGPSPAACELLDGLLLAARVERLRSAAVTFDQQFQFHLYDLDFCRSARSSGLTLGTWPLVVTHASSGNFGVSWHEALRLYFSKWDD